MPFFQIMLKAETENVLSIEPQRERTWAVKVQCSSCNEVTPNFLHVDENEEAGVEGGTNNLSVKCKYCKASIAATVNTASYGVYHVDTDSSSSDGIITIDFRGAEPTELDLDDQWIVTAESGATFDGVDLSAEWYDYDEKSAAPVSVKDVKVTFVRTKKTK